MSAKRSCVVLSAVIVSVLLLSGMANVIANGLSTETQVPRERVSGSISDLPEAGEYNPDIQAEKGIDVSPIVEPKPVKDLTGKRLTLSGEEREAAKQSLAKLKSGMQTLSAGSGGILPTELDAAVAHNASPAWAITKGAGTNIAIIDSGIDFGHDDLSGDLTTYFESWPRVKDRSSPYYGWPIAYDANAQGLYLKFGIPNALEKNDWMSSYANMRYRQIVTKDTGGTPATDYWGNKVAKMGQWTFYIPPGGDAVPPRILMTYPANNSNNIPPLTSLVILFSEPMDTSSFEAATTWTPAYLNGNITYTWSADSMMVTIKNASGSWPAGAITFRINQKLVYDTAGNPMGKWADPRQFTAVATDNTQPAATVTPANGATVVNTTCWVVMFSEQVNKTSAESGISVDTNLPIGFEWDETGTKVTVCPASKYLSNQAHSILVDATKVKDLAGNSLAASVASAITATATTNPDAQMIYPAPGSVDFPYYLKIGFTERMNPASMDLTKIARGLQIFPNDDVDLSKGWNATWNLAGTILTLTPKTPYRYNALYFSDFTVRIDDGSGKYLEYTDGNSLDGYMTLLKYPGGPKLSRLYAVDGVLSGGAYNNTSAAYRLGVHKDLNFISMFGERPGMLLTANASGGYDTVYVDLNDNQMFNDDTPITKTMSVSKIDYDFDGYIDADSGLLYWISDGKNLPPYSEHMAKHLNLTLPAPPGAGELVLMAGEFVLPDYDPGFGHGTQVAVGAAGRGFSDRVAGGMFTGIAPESSLIYTGSFAFTQLIDSANSLNNTLGMFYFAVEGYDGVPGTGDEAQVVALTARPPSGLSGLSFFDRFVDYITIDAGKGNTLFVTGAGEGGPGYGTISVFGGASTALTVGDAFHHYYRSLLGSDRGGRSQSGWINTFTASRGPTVSGQPKPDILAGGTYSWIAQPLSLGYNTGMGFPGMDLAGDDRVAAGTAAGAAALVYAGWNRSVFGAPKAWQVKGVLMGAATDLMNEPLTQGAGLLDAGRAVTMANASGPGVYAYIPGAYPSSSWVPGDFRGNSSNSFLKFVEPGKSYKQEIKVQNMGTQSATVDLTAGVYVKAGEWSYTYRSVTGTESFIVNRSGYYTTTGTNLTSVDSSLWDSENAIISIIYDRNTATKLGGRIDAFYWTDKNGNNIYDGTVERNRFAVINAATNVFQFIIPSPAKKVPSTGTAGKGIVLVCMESNPCPPDTLITIKVEFFNKAPGIVTLDKQNITIAPGKTGSFNATIAVPWDAGTGSYEAMIFYTANGKQSVIPVLGNIMGKGTSGRFAGGPVLNAAMYEANKVSLNGKMFYYFETPYDVIQRPATKGIIDIDAQYPGTGGDVQHYIEKAFGASDKDDPGLKNSAKYGSFKMVETDTGAPGSFTKQSGGISKAFTISPGINLLVVTYSQFAGKDTVESAIGEIGIFEFGPVVQDPDPAKQIVYVNTNQRSGLTPVYTRSTVEWKGIAGTATETISNTSLNQKILFNDPNTNYSGDFIEYLTRSGTKLYDNITSDVIIVSWHMIGTGNNKDSDMGVFYDANHDYIPTVDEFVKYDADSDSDEKVELVLPRPGMYIICLAGFDFGGSKEPSTYNWENLKTVLSSNPVIYPYGMPAGVIKPNEKGNFSIAWQLTKSEHVNKENTGAFFLAPGDAPLSFLLLVKITVKLDLIPMTIMNPMPADGSLVRTNKPAIAVQIGCQEREAQLDDTRTRLYVDNIDITGEGKVNRDSGSGSSYQPGGIVVELKSFSLADGEHIAKVVAYDWAGNVETFTWRFYVLASSPGLSILSPSQDRVIIKDTSYTITGMAPGATQVTIYAASIVTVRPSPSGEFTATVPLTPNAENLIRIEASNDAGNKATATRTIICDQSAPAILAFSARKPLTSDPMVQVTFKLDVRKEPGRYGAILNGMETAVLSDGTGVSTVMLLEGENTITLQSFDEAGNTATSTISVMKDSTPPILLVDEESFPSSGYTDQSKITVKGTFKDLLTNVTVTVNGKRADTSGKEGSFSMEVDLYSWSNTIVVTATDQAGNSVSVIKSVGYVIKGTNYGYILGALAIVLAVLGVIIGFLLGKGITPKEKKEEEEEKKEEEKKEEEEVPPPPEEEKKEEVPPPPEKTPEEAPKEKETDVLTPE